MRSLNKFVQIFFSLSHIVWVVLGSLMTLMMWGRSAWAWLTFAVVIINFVMAIVRVGMVKDIQRQEADEEAAMAEYYRGRARTGVRPVQLIQLSGLSESTCADDEE